MEDRRKNDSPQERERLIVQIAICLDLAAIILSALALIVSTAAAAKTKRDDRHYQAHEAKAYAEIFMPTVDEPRAPFAGDFADHLQP